MSDLNLTGGCGSCKFGYKNYDGLQCAQRPFDYQTALQWQIVEFLRAHDERERFFAGGCPGWSLSLEISGVEYFARPLKSPGS